LLQRDSRFAPFLPRKRSTVSKQQKNVSMQCDPSGPFCTWSFSIESPLSEPLAWRINKKQVAQVVSLDSKAQMQQPW
jgi:hypothetical protein